MKIPVEPATSSMTRTPGARRTLGPALAILLSALLATGCKDRERTAGAGHEPSAGAHAAAAPDPGVDAGLGDDPPFEWMGVYTLPKGTAELVLQPGPDESMDIALVPVDELTPQGLDAIVRTAAGVAGKENIAVSPGAGVTPGGTFYELQVGGTGEMRFPVTVPNAGKYALFTQHFADEFQTHFQSSGSQIHAEGQRIFKSRFGQIPIPPEAVKTFGIEVAAAETRTLTPSFTVPARVAFNAERVAQVGSAVAGRVTELKVRQGDVVGKDDVLIVLDSPELGEAQSNFLQARANVTTAAPAMELAKSGYDRAKALYDKDRGIPLTEVQKRQGEYQGAQGALRTAQAALTAAENKLQLLGMTKEAIEALGKSGEISPKYTVRAPIAGQVTRRDVTLGELARPDKDALLVLADMTTVWVLADVPEARLPDVAVGSPAAITVAALKNDKFKGTVSFVSPELNPSTRTAQVRIEVENGAGRLKPGMFAQAEISQPASPGAAAVLAIPDQAVQAIEGKPVVFVPMADKPHTFLKRPVTLEPAVGNYWPVRYGLQAGEQIVTEATFILKAELGKSGAKHDH